MAPQSEKLGEPKSSTGHGRRGETKLSGHIIIGELIRNMELGRFDMNYSVLLPCVYTVYLNPQDHATLMFSIWSSTMRAALCGTAWLR